MTALEITVVFHPLSLPQMTPPPGPERLNRFIAAVERHAGAPVRVAHGQLRDVAPATGFIFLAGTDHPGFVLRSCPPEQQADIIPRLVALEVSSTKIFESLLESLSIPAAVEWMSFLRWNAWAGPPRGVSSAEGLHGRRDIGALIGATCTWLESERYCCLESTAHEELPHLLVDYLRKLVEVSQGQLTPTPPGRTYW